MAASSAVQFGMNPMPMLRNVKCDEQNNKITSELVFFLAFILFLAFVLTKWDFHMVGCCIKANLTLLDQRLGVENCMRSGEE